MKSSWDKKSDTWSFEVTCQHCQAQQTVAEGKMYLVAVDNIPMRLPSFTCGQCGRTSIVMSGDMPIHVYQRLAWK